MCFAWISEQTAIFFLYSINVSVFLKQKQEVFTERDEMGL